MPETNQMIIQKKFAKEAMCCGTMQHSPQISPTIYVIFLRRRGGVTTVKTSLVSQLTQCGETFPTG